MRAFPCSVVVACGLWLLPATGYSQTFSFSTVTGQAGVAGTADGVNQAALLNGPGAVAVGPAGNVYVADTFNHTIRLLTPVGNGWSVTTLAGQPGISGADDGLNSAARFYYPYGITVDAAGIVYVADTYNHTIRKLEHQGEDWVVTTLVGSPKVPGNADGLGELAQFRYPSGLAVDGGGNLYVADTYNHTIRQVTPWGWVSTLAGLGGVSGTANGTNTDARFFFPGGVAVDQAGTLYVADTDNCMIRRVSLVGWDWVVTTLAGIQRYQGTADGTNRNALFSFPYGIAVDSATNLYVADTFINNTIRKIAPVGTNWVVSTIGGLPTVPGSADGAGANARFNEPYGVAVDANGRVWVADTRNHTIRLGQAGFALQQVLAGNQLVISWPSAATNFVLETSPSLAPGAAWTALTTGVYLTASGFVRTNSLGTAPAFFRLRAR